MANFVWGAGGAQLTPDQIAAQRKVAQAMMEKGMDYSPIQSPWQGAARVAQAMLGGFESRQADEAAKANQKAEADLLTGMFSGGQATPSSVQASASAPMGRLPSMGSRVYSENEFNPMDAAVATKDELAAGVPAPKQYASLIGKAAVDNDLPSELLAAQLKQESGFNPNAVSPAGATGISQFMPGTAREMGVSNPLDPAQAIPAGARYLRQNIDRFGGSVPLGLAAYNAGPGRVAQAGGDISRLPAETQGYVANITGATGTPAAATASAPAVNPALMRAMASPYISEGTKKVLGIVLQQQMEAAKNAADPLRQAQIQLAQKSLTKSDAPNSVQEYEYYKKNLPTGQQPMDYATWSTAKARASATTINNNMGDAENSFQKEAGKDAAKRFGELVSDGQSARQLLSDMDTLVDLGRSIGTGKGAQVKATLGPYAEALGLKVDGLSDIQAFEAVMNRVAPSLRVKGSGSQSDTELRNFLKSIPSLGNTQAGNETIRSVMQGMSQNKVLASEIASKALAGEISRSEAEKQLRNLPDPMEPYRAFKKQRGTVDDLVKKYGGAQ
jgi:soluble lytic murein transglycosylase-like protein